MAKRKIVWSNRAIKRLYGILEFYDKRNKYKTYSKKLYQLLQKEIKILPKFPETGLETTEETTRGLIIQDFIIYYQITDDKIIIHTIWDCRRSADRKISIEESELTPKVESLSGSVNLPDDFDYKKEISDYLEKKYLAE